MAVTVRCMIEIRMITESETDLFRSRVSRGFGGDADTDEASAERFRAIFDYERTIAAFDGDDIVGTAAGFSLGLTVPGGAEVPMAGTTVVTVQPTHRRRGVLRALMGHHLDDVAVRGEPLAGLWASESSIYGRFGYGPATFRYDAEFDAKDLAFVGESPEGTIRLLDADKVEPVLRSVYETARVGRAGMLTRSQAWWTHRLMADPETWREGKSMKRYAVYEQDGSVEGYAKFRQKEKWDDFIAAGELDVIEVIVTSARAHTGLWRFLSNIDLFPKVGWWNMAVDDPLPLKVSDGRRVFRKLVDGLWVRVMDIPTALTSRRYDSDGNLTFEVDDATRPANSGTYRLQVQDGVGSCESSPDEPLLRFGADVLGSLYLGGGDALALAAAGRIEGAPESVSALHRMFRTDAPPWCPEVF